MMGVTGGGATCELPDSEPEVSEILGQLKRILTSSWFRTSRRSCTLLRYVVEESLRGHSDTLKERLIAVNAFERSPDYDNNADPIVRAAAGDVRKRLAQYYGEADHVSQIRIELSAGSYVPSFQFPSREESAERLTETEVAVARDVEPLVLPQVRLFEIREPIPGPIFEPWFLRHWKWTAPASALVLLSALAAVWISIHFGTFREGFDAFWAPVISAPRSVLICSGELKAPVVQFVPNGERNRISKIWNNKGGQTIPNGFPVAGLATSLGASRVAGVLGAKGKTFDVQSESKTNFDDLSNRPAILLGAFDNDWTIRTTDAMPFRFEVDFESQLQWIADRDNPQQKIGQISYSKGYPSTYEDNAILSRSIDLTTKQPVVVIAGITGVGTLGAVEFATDPNYLNEFARHAPVGWAHKNIEFVLATKRVDGALGHPRIVAYRLW
jgi:hypothetical protein